MISVIIPSYRPGNYIWKCLDSLNEQTLPKSKFEIIIVLNGCNAPYYEMLKDGIVNYPQLQIRFLHTEEGGVSNARNIGLDTAIGEYVAFIDDDDWVSPVYLRDMLLMAKENCIVASNEIDFHEETGLESDSYITRAFKRYNPHGYVSLFKGRSLMSSSCCKMIPRKIIGDHRYDTHFRLGEDALFMASLSNAVRYIVLSNKEAIYYRRVRTTSASRKEETRWNKTKYALRLSAAYTKMYFSDVRRNDFLFFFSRIAASMHKIVKRSWI